MGAKVSVPPYPIEIVTKKNGNTLGDIANPLVTSGTVEEFNATAITQLATLNGDLITKDGRISQSVVMGFTNTFSVHIDVQNISAQTAFMLIDLSDTTNWPHTETGHVNLEYIVLEVDPDASYLGEVKLGFLTNVDGTNGDFNQVFDVDMAKKSDLLVETINFGSHGMDLEITHWFGPTIANSTLFQTDVNLLGPDGATSYPSGDGDLVMLVERSAGTVDISVTMGYEAVA
jgi:hypothetical protein